MDEAFFLKTLAKSLPVVKFKDLFSGVEEYVKKESVCLLLTLRGHHPCPPT